MTKLLSKTHFKVSALLVLSLIALSVFAATTPREVDAAEGSTWDFEVTYVGEDDPYDVFKDHDFNLKYEVEFHTSEDIPAYDPDTGIGVVIRIPATLLKTRSGGNIHPADFGIPMSDPRSESWKPKKTKNSAFNYYIDETTDEVVFFNYEPITAGSNDAWQVVYKNINLMQIVDGSTWSMQPKAEVSVPQGDGGSEKRTETSAITPLTGSIDTTANLTSVTKTANSSTGKAYGPGLYTEKQVSQYISGDLPEEYKGDNFAHYKYVLYKVSISGNGNQPFNLGFIDTTSIEGVPQGQIVGSILDKSEGTPALGLQGYKVWAENSAKSSWTETFNVVVAYPADQVDVGTIVENNIEVKLVPYDGLDAPQLKSAKAQWSYANYDWHYAGDIIGIQKGSDDTYPGWLKVYNAVSRRSDDESIYADFPFSTTSTVRAFDVTHVTAVDAEGKVLGEVDDPTASYRTSTVDDAVYGAPAGDSTDAAGVMLDSTNYYFTSVSVIQKDYGYDVWEDDYAPVEEMADTNRQGIQIYAMFAKPSSSDRADEKGWVKVTDIPWDPSGNMSYTFPAEVIAKEPYRVRVDHETINYSTTCTIDVDVHIRANAPKMLEWFNRQNDLPNVQFENVSGVTGEVLKNGTSYEPIAWFHDYTIHDSNYQEPGLSDWSQDMYGTLPMRDSAFKNVTQVEEHSGATKSATTENDVINGRVNVRFAMTAGDGYHLYSDEAAKYLKSIGEEEGLRSPGRKELVFYDLLPYAMEYDPSTPPVAGRMTAQGQTNENAWDKNQVSVTLDKDNDIIQNWNGTERTLLIFHVHYSGDDPAFFSNSTWSEGWGVAFSAFWSWTNLEISDEAPNIVAFQPAKDDNEPLRGTPLQDNGSGTDALGADLDGDGNQEEKNVLFASCRVMDDVPMAAQNSIHKYVKADSDVFGQFRQTTAVEPSGTYTYEITTTNPSHATMENIVIYDHIENAAHDRDSYGVELYGDLNFAEHQWKGTLLSIDTTEAELLGIEPVIWANASDTATTEELKADVAPSEVLTADKGWYKWDQFLSQNGNDPSKAKSIAVDLTNLKSGGKFVLGSMQSISIRIHMKAPAEVPENTVWAYNNPLFYASHESSHTQETVAGDSVRVALGSPKDLSVEKEFTGDTPQPVHDYFDDEPFRIQILECPFYDPAYGVACPNDNVDAWKADHEGEDVPAHEHLPFSDRVYELYNLAEDGSWVQDTSRIYSTDEDGYLEIKATQKAIFKAIPEPGRFVIAEEESPFWDVEYTNETTDDAWSVLVENLYKPVLYAQKELDAVPSTEAGEAARQQGFTYQVFVNDEPAGVTEYWYVTEAYMNGAIPQKDTSKGDNGIGYTDAEGKFTIHAGDIIALRPGRSQDKWEIREVGFEAEDWICKEPSQDGALEVLGSSATITNTYRWKDLLLEKLISHQDAEEAKGQAFTFKVEKAIDTDDDTTYSPVNGERWVVMDGNNEMTAERWEALGRTGAYEGTLSDDGKFTCCLAGLTVKIEHLDAETTYRISEPREGYGAPNYLPVTGNLAVKMPLHSTSKNASYTNDWRKRPLTVKKLVEYDKSGSYAAAIEAELATKTFEMTVEIKDPTAGIADFTPLINFPYKKTTQAGTTESGKTDGQGKLTLKGNEYVVFKDAGYIGAEFRVTETPDSSSSATSFKQLSPKDGAPAEVELTQDENVATIVNGPEANLTIEKAYFIPEGDTEARDFYTKVCQTLDKQNKGQALSAEESALLERAQVTFRVKVKNAEGIWEAWPDKDYEMDMTDYAGTKTKFTWKKGAPLDIYPGQAVTTVAGQIDPTAEYMVTELAEDKQWIWRLRDDKWLQCEQTSPANGRSLTGTVVTNADAKVVNTLSGFDVTGSVAEKHMLLGSEDVPEGAELTWIVEEYDEARDNWKPAEGIPYITFAGKGDHNWTEEEVLETPEDGRIVLTASEAGLPWIRFVSDKVYLGDKDLPANGDLRVRELLDESDLSWGQLVGYVKEGADDIFYEDDEGKSGVTLDPSDAVAFANTNRTTVLEVAKEVSEPTDSSFTMVLEHIIQTSDGKAPADDLSNVSEKIFGANLPYTIFDTATGEEVGSGVTNEFGELTLRGGQYAHFELPDKTFWLVHEKETVGWELKDLTPHNEAGDGEELDPAIENGNLYKIGDTAMLARQRAATMDVMLKVRELEPKKHTAGEALTRDAFEVTVVDTDGGERVLTAKDPWRLIPSSIPAKPFGDGQTTGTWYVDVWYGSLHASVPIEIGS